MNPNSQTKMESGKIINGFTSKMWIERYNSAGEFKLIGPISAGVREELPIGSFVSHVNSKDIMIVENHEINDSIGNESMVTISGRGFETILENRVFGINQTFPSAIDGGVVDTVLSADFTWNQAVSIISSQITTAATDDNFAIPYLNVYHDVATGTTGTYVERKFPRGDIYTAILNLLKIDNLGIKIIRPGIWSSYTPNISFGIHKGIDKSGVIVFSYDSGEIVTADYLWSNKDFKNGALISGKWVETVVLPSETGYLRRMTHINASDIDKDYTSKPTGSALTSVINAMQQRGYEVLSIKNNTKLAKAEVAKGNSTTGTYRIDFDVGDIIMVSGDYNQTSKMRISEYVETEDSTGASGYPTLELVNDNPTGPVQLT